MRALNQTKPQKSSETPWTQKLLILPLVSAACRGDATEESASFPAKGCMCAQLFPSSCKLLFSRVSGNSRQTPLSFQRCGCQSGPPPIPSTGCLPEGRLPSDARCQNCRMWQAQPYGWMGEGLEVIFLWDWGEAVNSDTAGQEIRPGRLCDQPTSWQFQSLILYRRGGTSSNILLGGWTAS